MSEGQRPVRQVLKKCEVLCTPSAMEMGMAISAMLLLNQGWQLYGPTGAVSVGEGVEYFQTVIQYVLEEVPEDTENQTKQ